MKKDLLISLGVMLLLTIIVGFTSYTLTNTWSALSNKISITTSKGLLLEEIVNYMNRQVKLVDDYIENPSNTTPSRLIELRNSVQNNLIALQNIENLSPKDEFSSLFIGNFYNNYFYPIVQQIIEAKNRNADKDYLLKRFKELEENSLKLTEHIYLTRNYIVKNYKRDLETINAYSKNVTLTITIISVMLGFVLTVMIFRHLTGLYERIHSQARALRRRLEEINNINRDLIASKELNIKIQEAERLRIAQDLHDDIIQGLISLIRATNSNLEKVSEQKMEIELKQTVSKIRRICQNLRPSILNDLGLYSAIEWLLDDLEKYGVVPHINIDTENAFSIEEKAELVIFRVIQELVNNIKKHSNANNAWLNLFYNEYGVTIKLEDDGQGFVYEEGHNINTLGLLGLKERVKSVSGNISFESSPGQGTRVLLEFPLENIIRKSRNENGENYINNS